MRKIVLILLISCSVLLGQSNLQWQYDRADSTMEFKDAIEYCQDLRLASKSDWRLPNLSELTDLSNSIDYVSSPKPYYFWSSSVFKAFNITAWFVSFNDDYQHYSLKTNKHYVRCVREKKSD